MKDCTGNPSDCQADGGECGRCAARTCAFSDPMHWHHDGCPACATASKADWDRLATLTAAKEAALEAGLAYVAPGRGSSYLAICEELDGKLDKLRIAFLALRALLNDNDNKGESK